MRKNNIQPSTGETVFYKDGNTVDIQNMIFKVNKDRIWEQTREFSKQFEPTRASLRELWRFVKYEIQYKEDPDGKQYVQYPSRLWYNRQGDCKSFTLFIVSVLQNLGVPYTIRFTRYEAGAVTHVYPVAHLPEGDVILDAVWTSFDSEKTYYGKAQNFKFQKKKNMAEIYALKGFGVGSVSSDTLLRQWERATADIDPSVVNTGGDVTQMSEIEFYKFLGFGVNRIGSTDTSGKAFSLPLVFNTPSVSGIGKGKIKEAAKKVKEKVKEVASKLKEQWSKLVNWLFKGALDKAAPFFLFTFLKNKLSDRIATKVSQQNRILDFIAKVAEIDRQKIDATLRAAIVKQQGKQPEQILNAAAGGNIAGIGVIDPVTISAAFKVLLDIIQKIMAFFKAKKEAQAAPTIDASSGSDLSELKNAAKATGDTEPAGDPSDKKIVIKQAEGKDLPRDKKATTETNDEDTEDNNGSSTPNTTNNNTSNTGILLGVAAIAVIGYTLTR
jgi:predicted transglutaminase-like cysteine proteinase